MGRTYRTFTSHEDAKRVREAQKREKRERKRLEKLYRRTNEQPDLYREDTGLLGEGSESEASDNYYA